MGLLVDVRTYRLDNLMKRLVEASEIKKKWFRKTDNYWRYLETASTYVPVDLSVHLMADLFSYIQDKLNYRESLHQYSDRISGNRNSFVILLVANDRDYLLQVIATPYFYSNFKTYVTELNGEYYNYTSIEIEETIEGFITLLSLIDENVGLIINIGS